MDGFKILTQDAAPVKASLQDLPHSVQITHELLTNLSTQRGYCWAFNKTLAQLRKVSIATIKRHIVILMDAGLLLCRHVGHDRRLYPVVPDNEPPMSHLCATREPLRNTKETLRATKETASFVCNKTNSVSDTRTGMRGQPHSGTPSVQAEAPPAVPDTSESEILHNVMPQSVEVTASGRIPERKEVARHEAISSTCTPTVETIPPILEKVGSGDSLQRFAQGVRVSAETSLLHDLEDFGVSLAARQLVASTASPDAILRTMAYCRKRGYGAGALIRAIREGWTIPEEKKPEREPRYSLAEPQKPRERPDGTAPDMSLLRAALKVRATENQSHAISHGGG